MQVTNDMSLLSLLTHASVPVQLIMLLLLGISILPWTYIFAQRLAIKRAHAQTRRFEDDFWSGGDLSMLQQAVASRRDEQRSEEHTSELQSLMRISYAVFCLKKKKQTANTKQTIAYS